MTLVDRTGGSKVTELLRSSFQNLNQNIFIFLKNEREIQILKYLKRVGSQRVNHLSGSIGIAINYLINIQIELLKWLIKLPTELLKVN